MKRYSPMTANTIDKVCTLKTDNYDTGGFWILSDGGCVSIAEQESGESAKAIIAIPRDKFN